MTDQTSPFARLGSGSGTFGSDTTPAFREGGSSTPEPEAPKPAATGSPNKYAGNCIHCSSMVDVGVGLLIKVDGKWKVQHKAGECHEGESAVQQTLELVDPNSFAIWEGRYTLEHGADGHRTFQVRVQDSDADFAPGELLIEFLSGPDNTNDYTTFGFVKPGARVVVWKRFRENEALVSDMAEFVKVWNRNTAKGLPVGDFFAALDDDGVLATRRCARCHEDLTVPESVRRGYGPICAGKGLA